MMITLYEKSNGCFQTLQRERLIARAYGLVCVYVVKFSWWECFVNVSKYTIFTLNGLQFNIDGNALSVIVISATKHLNVI